MDLQQLNDQMNEALNRWLQQLKIYFSNLNQNEQYAWVLMASGLVVFIAGIVLI